MTASHESKFRKQRTCPSEAALLLYEMGQLREEFQACIADHLRRCDFCGAELQLLSNHPQDAGCGGSANEIPMRLKKLAEALLSNSPESLDEFLDSAYTTGWSVQFET